MAGVGPVPMCGLLLKDFGASVRRILNPNALSSQTYHCTPGSTESKPRGQLTLGDDPETKDVVNAANFMREI